MKYTNKFLKMPRSQSYLMVLFYVLWMLEETTPTAEKKNMSELTPLQIQQKQCLKNNRFAFEKKTLKQNQGTAIDTKFAPPYSILFMTELEEDIIK